MCTVKCQSVTLEHGGEGACFQNVHGIPGFQEVESKLSASCRCIMQCSVFLSNLGPVRGHSISGKLRLMLMMKFLLIRANAWRFSV